MGTTAGVPYRVSRRPSPAATCHRTREEIGRGAGREGRVLTAGSVEKNTPSAAA